MPLEQPTSQSWRPREIVGTIQREMDVRRAVEPENEGVRPSVRQAGAVQHRGIVGVTRGSEDRRL